MVIPRGKTRLFRTAAGSAGGGAPRVWACAQGNFGLCPSSLISVVVIGKTNKARFPVAWGAGFCLCGAGAGGAFSCALLRP
jgi:hypothetical protein